MRVFLDVGAHVGETVEAVLDPKYRFERIVCFEPAAVCRQALDRFVDPRVEVMPFGLSKRTGERQLFGAGTPAASLFAEIPAAEQQPPELCRFVRASDWFTANVAAGDVLFLKLNCEGSECDIIDDLVDTGVFAAISQVLIDFDVRKIPSQRHREFEIREKLARSGLSNYRYAEDVMIGKTHIARIQNWLHQTGADSCATTTKLAQAFYLLRAPAHVRRAVLGGRYGRAVRTVRRRLHQIR